ncbi:MAG: ATP-dependent Clp protease ATP-binding subunit [Clostridium sp.]
MMFGGFTERSQKVVLASAEAAKELGHSYVGTEHLLIGMMEEGSNASDILGSFGVTVPELKNIIITIEGKGIIGFEPKNLPLTPRNKRIIEVSRAIARALSHNFVAPEHILLAILEDGECLGYNILKRMSVDMNLLKEKLIASFGTSKNQGNTKSTKKASNPKELEKFARNLTALAGDGKLDPIIGRDSETERVVEILSRRSKNNPCLIGEPGVGKTAIAEGLAQRIVEGKVPEILKGKKVYTLDITSMLAGAKYRGEFEERLKSVMNEVREAGDLILFVDEVHTIVGAGASEGSMDASNILKPALSRGEIQLIGATTIEEYRKYIEKDPALERRFQPVLVGEPTKEEALAILTGLRDKYEAHHRLHISDEALKAAVELSARYISDRFLPDKAIDLMDEASARVRIKNLTAPEDVKGIEDELESIRKEKEEAVGTENFEKAAQLKQKENEVLEKLSKAKSNWSDEKLSDNLTVTEEDIAFVVSRWSGIPVNRLSDDESQRLLKLEEILHERVVGQEEAVEALSRAVRRARVGLKDPNRPIGSFIFLGPTGVGKTELSKALAEAMFGSEGDMIRIDMSEYMEKHAVSRLIGSPPGYVGYEEGGQLTEAVRRNPYSVILFDEIEKAHSDVFNVLLQILEDGRVTSGQGKTIDFKNTIVILTSNLGAHTIDKMSMGFDTGDESREIAEHEKMKERILEDLKRHFRPEFLNRIDDIVIFHKLTEKDIEKIVSLMLDSVCKRLVSNNINLDYTPEVIAHLAKVGYDRTYGARPLRRAITKTVEDKLSEEMLRGNVKKGDSIIMDYKDGEVTFIPKGEYTPSSKDDNINLNTQSKAKDNNDLNEENID